MASAPASNQLRVDGKDQISKGAFKARRKEQEHKTKSHPPLNARALADVVARAALEHKVLSPVLLNLTGLSSIADWFFIASAENSRSVRAVAEKIIRRTLEVGVKPLGHEGLNQGETRWVLLDLGDVIVHIFNPETRALYDLESLWADAPRIEHGAAAAKADSNSRS
ncbi:MAG: ribosome silencing factor [Deltaproteobacteria bacterium]|nr:ribosome silencing factor [Deltaproteobacteria bacterium]